MSKTSRHKKLQKHAQGKAGAGWNKHVSPQQRLRANKVMRRFLKRENTLDE